MTLGQRLKKFISERYGSQKIFADVTGISRVNLSKYIYGTSSPNANTLAKFKEAGLSIDWLIDGSGSMLILEEANEIPKGNQAETINLPFDRLKGWIEENYGTVGEYALAINYDLFILENILKHELFPDPDFITLVKKSGCNTDWLVTGTGSHFADNHTGNLLRLRKENFLPENSDTYGIDIEKIRNLAFQDFYEFIKSTVAIELDKRKGNQNAK